MRGLSEKTIELLLFARALLAEFNPMTLRQLHYAIFSAAKIAYDNTQADYKRLSRATTTARRLYRWYELNRFSEHLIPDHAIPPGWIVDEVRESEIVSMWDDLAGYMDCVKTSYRRNNWADQPNHVEIFSEKATVLGSLRPITQKYGVMLRACRGFGSTGMETVIGDLFEGIKKPITVFYLGDHDPSGIDIQRDIHQRAQSAQRQGFRDDPAGHSSRRHQGVQPAAAAIKATDSRARGFEERFGKKAPTVELDALPVEELRRRVTEAIEGLIDFDLWNRQVAVQEVELQCIADFVDTVKNLPRAPQ